MSESSEGRVYLDFEVLPDVLAKHSPPNPAKVDAGDLRQILLDMPTRMLIDDVTLIKGDRIPVYYLAGELRTLRNLRPGHSTRIHTPYGPTLSLSRQRDSQLVLISKNEETPIPVMYHELLSAWERFTERVRTFLQNYFPEMLNDKKLGPWLRREVDDPPD